VARSDVYNYFRDYDSTTGRFEQSDPVGIWDGVNTYAYARSSPADGTDPRGLLRRGLSCSDFLWRRVQFAEFLLRNELSKPCESCKNGAVGCIPCNLRQALLSQLDLSTVNCNLLRSGACASANTPGIMIFLNQSTFDQMRLPCVSYLSRASTQYWVFAF
jgi:hypothetical protein